MLLIDCLQHGGDEDIIHERQSDRATSLPSELSLKQPATGSLFA
jgi:hypothetical protein